MGQVFAFSFDEAVPSANWNLFICSIVPGRTNDGAQLGLLRKTLGATYAQLYGGVAWKPASFGGHVKFYNPSVPEGCEIELENVGDGRFYVTFFSFGNSRSGAVPFALNEAEYAYAEFFASVAGVVSLDPPPRFLTITVNWEVRVNNLSYASGTFLQGPVVTSRPPGVQADIQWSNLEYTLVGVIDDGYIRDDHFVGDSTVDASDVVTQNPVDIDITQAVAEIAAQPTDGNVDFTQVVAEVTQSFPADLQFTQVVLECIVSIGMVLSCPSSTAIVGGFYASAFTVTGGTAPFVFSIISGFLPPGLTLNTTTGGVTGTPNLAGTFAYTGQVTDSVGRTATASCSIMASSACILYPITTPSPALAAYNEPTEQQGS